MLHAKIQLLRAPLASDGLKNLTTYKMLKQIWWREVPSFLANVGNSHLLLLQAQKKVSEKSSSKNASALVYSAVILKTLVEMFGTW